MDLVRLSLFRDIARERSITRGAENHNISQSAASQHVKDLESDFGVPLLDRTTRPFELTSAGKEYDQFCRDVLRRKEEFDAALNRMKQTVEGSVRVASIYSIGLPEMSRWEAEFRSRHPSAELTVEFLRPDRVYEAIRTDAADLGLVSYPEPSRDLTILPWRKEVMVVATRPEHPLSANTFLSPGQLNGHDFIGFDEDLPIARELRRYLREAGAEVNRVMHFDNVLMIKEAVALGTGISILPARIIADEIAQERLIGIPLKSPGLYRPLGIIHRRRKRFSPAAKAFLEQLQ